MPINIDSSTPVWIRHTVIVGVDKIYFWFRPENLDRALDDYTLSGLLSRSDFVVSASSQALVKGQEVISLKNILTHFLNANPFSSERKYVRHNTGNEGEIRTSFLTTERSRAVMVHMIPEDTRLTVEENADVIIVGTSIFKNNLDFKLEHVMDTALTGAYFPTSA